jgi:hypothetical protein
MFSSFYRALLFLSPRCLLAVVAMGGSIPYSGAQELDPENFVIENVYIASVDADDVAVNLLVQDDKLKLISKDSIPIPEGIAAFDGKGAYLVGNLTLGEPPSFMILDGDPRVDFEVLLDVDTRAVFAVVNGEVRYNRLEFAADMLEPQADRGSWHAYELRLYRGVESLEYREHEGHLLRHPGPGPSVLAVPGRAQPTAGR